MDDKLAILQTKKIGLFIKDAREKSGQSIEEIAVWLAIDPKEYKALENGKESPSLPQLESLAYLMNTSFDYLLKGPSEDTKRPENFSREMNNHLLDLRNRVIAAQLKQNREQKEISLEKLAALTGTPVEELESFETGLVAIPFITLERIFEMLDLTPDAFFSTHGPFSHETVQESHNDAVQKEELPAELQEFISRSVNRPYLELAMRLSEMEADKLRSIAASLLEITY
jgi:transcriptional regulator with XRE-family HTH domain